MILIYYSFIIYEISAIDQLFLEGGGGGEEEGEYTISNSANNNIDLQILYCCSPNEYHHGFNLPPLVVDVVKLLPVNILSGVHVCFEYRLPGRAIT